MKRDLQGSYVPISTAGEAARAFVPSPLPPIPPIEWSSELREKFDQALLALGERAGRIQAEPELDRWQQARKCAICPPAPGPGSGVHGKIGIVSSWLA